LISSVIIYTYQKIKADTKFASLVTLMVMLGFITMGNFLAVMVNEDLKRLKADEEK
jgi:hypothetical protein